MKREAGFSLAELMVSIALMLIILSTTLGALTSATRATEGILLMSDTQQNLRAALNYTVRDILQAGTGIPEGGITVPNSGGASPTSAIARPGPVTPPATSFGNFPNTWTTIPAITAGFRLGPTTAVSGVGTDMVTVLYADTSLLDINRHWLNEFPIYLDVAGGTAGCAAGNASPRPQGSIVTAGTTTTITFDPSCIRISDGNTGLQPGDLIMLQNNNTTSGDPSITGTDADIANSTAPKALLYVSSVNVAANSIAFSAGDPFGLNSSGQPTGTIRQIQNPVGSGTYPATAATRISMITFYIDNSNPQRPQLMRQVNLRPAQAVGEIIEHMQIFYDVLNAGSSPASVTAAVENPTAAQLAYIRDAYITMYARSENPFSQTGKFFRNNLTTVVSIRGLDFYNKFD